MSLSTVTHVTPPLSHARPTNTRRINPHWTAMRESVTVSMRKIIPAYYMPHFKPWYPHSLSSVSVDNYGTFSEVLPPSLRSFRVLMRTNLKDRYWLEQFRLGISVGLKLMPFNLKWFLRKVSPQGVLQRNSLHNVLLVFFWPTNAWLENCAHFVTGIQINGFTTKPLSIFARF